MNNLAPCPGHGQPVCPRCLWYFINHFGYDGNHVIRTTCPQSLYAAEDDGFCWACPAPDECPYVESYAQVFFWLAAACLASLAMTLCVK